MLRLLRRQMFLVGLVVVLVLAIAAPNVGRAGGPLAPERWQGLLLSGMFLMSGIELRTRALGVPVGAVRLRAFVQGVSLVLAPVLFFAVARSVQATTLSESLLEGFVVLG